jgi:peroxin-2
MTGLDLLENAWEAAKPRLAAITSSLDLSTSAEQRIIRVGQIDAELLDQELAQILQEPIAKALSLVDVRTSILSACAVD